MRMRFLFANQSIVAGRYVDMVISAVGFQAALTGGVITAFDRAAVFTVRMLLETTLIGTLIGRSRKEDIIEISRVVEVRRGGVITLDNHLLVGQRFVVREMLSFGCGYA